MGLSSHDLGAELRMHSFTVNCDSFSNEEKVAAVVPRLHYYLMTIIALSPTSMFQSLSLLPYTGLLGTLLTLTAHHLLLNFPVFQSFHMLKIQTSSVTFCAL